MKARLLLILFLLGSLGTFAQKKVPMDPSIRKGVLKNGLTYYIRANQKPAERADFYIVTNAGATLENPDQDGLAHFCEHMAFNGTKNFPKKGVLNFLERIGVKFGHNVNAFTSTDVTCYNLSDVPVTKQEYIDSALLVLHDWSHYVSFEAEEIDAERGVIHEEWRTRRTSNRRLHMATMPTIYKNSRYAERDVIGKLDVIDNCSYETMRNFYKDWYRTDLQAIIIVGDIDVDAMEKQVIELCSKIPATESPKERTLFELPDNKEPLIAIATDKEAANSKVKISYKHDIVKPADKDMKYLRTLYIRKLISFILRSRLQELTQQENPPFVYSYAYYGDFVRTKDAFSIVAMAKTDNIEKSFTTILTEGERMKRYGFLPSELKRAKMETLSYLEKAYNNRDKEKNSRYVWKCFDNFLTNEPIPGIENEFSFAKEMFAKLTIDEVNQLAQSWIRDENIVVSITGPEKEGVVIPTEEQILKHLKNIAKQDIKAYEETVSDEPLVAKVPKGSKIVKENANKDLDATEWELANGVKVVLKRTDFDNDEISMTAISKGGSSLYPNEYIPTIQMLNPIISLSGVANFSQTDLDKKLAGKVVYVSPSIEKYQESFKGKSSIKDFETMLQLTYLYFTKPRFDEKACKAMISRYDGLLKNKSANPASRFRDSLSVIMADYHPRIQPMNCNSLKKVDFNKIKEIYKDRFADASDFTFIFVGNVDLKKMKPMVESYLGALPSINRKENFKDNKVRPPHKVVDRDIYMDLKVPKSTVFIDYTGETKYDAKTKICLRAIEHILDLRFTEEIRENSGGTYGVSVWEDFNRVPYENYEVGIYFDCDPEKAETLKDIVYAEINKLKKEGPSQVDLDKAVKYFLKSREENKKKNKFWLNVLKHNYKYNENIASPENYEKIVNSLDRKMIQKVAKKLLNDDQHVEVIMKPKKS